MRIGYRIQTRPDESEQACDFDEQIRFLPGIRGQCFVHRSCVPLREMDLPP